MREELHCFILARRDIGEWDRLYTAYSRERGRCAFRARGIRKATSKLAPFLMPFAPLSCEILGNGRYPVLVGAEFQSGCEQPTRWDRDIANIAFGEAVSEFFSSMVRGDESDDQLYTWFVSSIVTTYALFSEDERAFELRRSWILYSFLSGLSVLLGYGLGLSSCVQCGAMSPGTSKEYLCSSQHGGFVCSSCAERAGLCATFSSSDLALLRLLFEGDFHALMTLPEGVPWERVRQFLDRHFRQVAERDLLALGQYWQYV